MARNVERATAKVDEGLDTSSLCYGRLLSQPSLPRVCPPKLGACVAVGTRNALESDANRGNPIYRIRGRNKGKE